MEWLGNRYSVNSLRFLNGNGAQDNSPIVPAFPRVPSPCLAIACMQSYQGTQPKMWTESVSCDFLLKERPSVNPYLFASERSHLRYNWKRKMPQRAKALADKTWDLRWWEGTNLPRMPSGAYAHSRAYDITFIIKLLDYLLMFGLIAFLCSGMDALTTMRVLCLTDTEARFMEVLASLCQTCFTIHTALVFSPAAAGL